MRTGKYFVSLPLRPVLKTNRTYVKLFLAIFIFGSRQLQNLKKSYRSVVICLIGNFTLCILIKYSVPTKNISTLGSNGLLNLFTGKIRLIIFSIWLDENPVVNLLFSSSCRLSGLSYFLFDTFKMRTYRFFMGWKLLHFFWICYEWIQ